MLGGRFWPPPRPIPPPIEAVMIATTHFTNAVVERRRLLQVAAIRLGLAPRRASLPPLTDWPEISPPFSGGTATWCGGGHELRTAG